MEKKRCFFIGHRDAPEEIYPKLYSIIEKHIICYGVTDFIVGHYGRFDTLVAKALKDIKLQYPNIEMTLLLPYYSSKAKKFGLEEFDHIFYPPNMEFVPHKAAIVKANRYVVNYVDYLIAFVSHPASNAWELLKYAQIREKRGEIYITQLS